MHIAICDDNIADRKQTERLLRREADKMRTEGEMLYIDSYGSCEELAKTPMLYDGFLIDIRHTQGCDSALVIKTLRDKGVTAPVCAIYMRETEEIPVAGTDKYPEDTLFMGKPVRPEALHEIIAKMRESQKDVVPGIELRNEFTTLYVAENEIIRAEQNGLNTDVILTGDRVISVRGDAYTFFETITKGHACFIMPSLTSVLNLNHVDHLQMRKAFLPDGKSFKIDRQVIAYVKAYMAGEI